MKKGYMMIAAAAFAAAAVCAGTGIRHYRQEQSAGKEYEAVRGEAVLNRSESGQEVREVPEEEEAYISEASVREEAAEKSEPVKIPIDFAALTEQNPDVYAWIRIPGTNVDYPILQREDDNTYYLTHTIDHEKAKSGAIYTEDYNSRDFEDPNTVIYGHNMKNGTMFRTLHNYEDRSFFDENREVLIYTPDAIRHYEIFAAYVYDNRHLLLNFDFEDPGVYQKYLEEIFSMRDMNAFVDTSIKVGTEDRIITLSTCYRGISERRYLVQAVLVSIEK